MFSGLTLDLDFSQGKVSSTGLVSFKLRTVH